MKRILVTGAGGFIGRHAVTHLVSAGYDVHAWRRKQPGHPEPGVTTHTGDLLNEADQVRVLREARASHLLHLAWYTVPGKYWSALENLTWTAASLQLLLNFSQAGGTRCVLAGTCAEYEWKHENVCSEDQTPKRPRSLYGVCKNSLNEIASLGAGKMGIEVGWGRIFFLYGPHEAPQRFVPSIVCSLLAGRAAHCSHGEQVRDFMHVDDVARAFVTVVDSGHTGSINIASGAPASLAAVAGIIGDRLENRELIKLGSLAAPQDEPHTLLADTSRLQALGFRPRFDLRLGIADTIQWWLSNPAVRAPDPVGDPQD